MLKNFILITGMITLLSFPSRAGDQPALIPFRAMTLETAQKLAQATLDDCRKKGCQEEWGIMNVQELVSRILPICSNFNF